MKTQLIGVFGLALLTVASLFAEMTPRMTAHIPFGFHVGNSVLPAGEYTVDTEPGPGLVRLRSADCKSSVTILANAVQSLSVPRESKLIFSKYGDDYFLSRIWKAGSDTGNELRKSRRETEVAATSRRGTQTIMASK
jgi:hypothetical protein